MKQEETLRHSSRPRSGQASRTAFCWSHCPGPGRGPQLPPRLMAIPGAARPHRVSSKYLHRPNGRLRTVASPGDPGPSQWPGDFPAGPLPGSAPPARGWTARCVWLGGLHQGCRLCFRHLQKKKIPPLAEPVLPSDVLSSCHVPFRAGRGVLYPAPPALESLSAHPPQAAPARGGPGLRPAHRRPPVSPHSDPCGRRTMPPP